MDDPFRNFLLQITIHIRNYKTKLKYLLDFWLFILQVTFVNQVSISFYRIVTV